MVPSVSSAEYDRYADMAYSTHSGILGLEDRIGTVKEGKDADLILVDGDPLADIRVMTKLPAHVFRAGIEFVQ